VKSLLMVLAKVPAMRCSLTDTVHRLVQNKPIPNSTLQKNLLSNNTILCLPRGCPNHYIPDAPCQCTSNCEILGTCCVDYQKCGNYSTHVPLDNFRSHHDMTANVSALKTFETLVVHKERSLETPSTSARKPAVREGSAAAPAAAAAVAAAAAAGADQSKMLFDDTYSCVDLGCANFYVPLAPCQCEGTCFLYGQCCWDYQRCGNGGVGFPFGSRHGRSAFNKSHPKDSGLESNLTEEIHP